MSFVHTDSLASLEVEIWHELHAGAVDLSVSNTTVYMVLAVLLSVILLRWMVSRAQIVPGRAQLLAESLYRFVEGIVESNMRRDTERYMSVMFSLFVFILSCNLVGLFPGIFSPTAQIVVTATMAVCVFLYAIVLRIRLHGWRFFTMFAPPGVPFWVLPLLIPIELLSFLARPVTLALRLFANMTAGHAALGVLAMLGIAAPWFLQWLPLGFTAMQVALELLIAFIQAYIFVTLACVYIDDALTEH